MRRWLSLGEGSMRKESQERKPCSGCGLLVEEGEVGCHRFVEQLWAREFSDPAYFRVHRLCVDAYCLQHPDKYCISVKSFVAHFVNLGWFVEYSNQGRLRFHEKLKQWLHHLPSFEKPQLPLFRGQLTVASVLGAGDPETYTQAVGAWAKSVWEAYAPLHPIAKAWFEQVLR